MGPAPSPLERLAAVARSRSFPADDAVLSRLVAYLEAVVERTRVVNLTAASTLDQAVDVLALSALAVSRAWEGEVPPKCIVDLGTGNGLPGVAAALAWPAADVRLLERRHKKARAVADCVAAAGIDNAVVVACDARELLRERPELAFAVDLVTVRAVGTLEQAVQMTNGWLAPCGRIAHWKGTGLAAAEQARGDRAARAAGLTVRESLAFPDDAGPAHVVLYER